MVLRKQCEISYLKDTGPSVFQIRTSTLIELSSASSRRMHLPNLKINVSVRQDRRVSSEGSIPKSSTLELYRGGAWKRLTVHEAIARHQSRGRCIECHKSVRVHSRSANGRQAAHVEHLSGNPKCSLSDPQFRRAPAQTDLERFIVNLYVRS